MDIGRVGNITLRGEDSVRLINALMRPSKEEIRRQNQILDQIDNGVRIEKNSRGFDARIDGLDLSFLDKRECLQEYSMVDTWRNNYNASAVYFEDAMPMEDIVTVCVSTSVSEAEGSRRLAFAA